jgi:hypothetical protein
LKILLTFRIGAGTALNITTDAQGQGNAPVYHVVEEAVSALMVDHSPNPVVDLFGFAMNYLAPKVVARIPIHYIKPELIKPNGKIPMSIMNKVAHHFTFYAARSLKIAIADILVEDRQISEIPIFDGELLAINKSIEQFYGKRDSK